MSTPEDAQTDFDIVATAVDEPPVTATAVPDFWQKNNLNKMWVVIGSMVGGTFLFGGMGFLFLTFVVLSASQPNQYNNPYGYSGGYGQQGFGMTPSGGQEIWRTPDGGYMDSQGSWGSGTGMSSGTIDQSGGGNDVISSDGQVLTLPY